MLKELLRIWKGGDLLSEALTDFLSMIDAVESMFKCATDALFGVCNTAEASDAIHKTDIQVNKTEREIRKRLVEHLAINPRRDAPACLVLMSVSKDAERAGDYCKNLLEVAEMAHAPVLESRYADVLREMRDLVLATFGKTRQAFSTENHVLGHEVIVEEVRIAKRSDAMVETIANDADLNSNEAVCLALAFRFFKRVNAHLGNIASGVVMPLHKLDYFDEKWKRQDTPESKPKTE